MLSQKLFFFTQKHYYPIKNLIQSICIDFYSHIFMFFGICIPVSGVRMSHSDRDVNMKRQLVEDLKTRLKFLQEMEKSYRGQVEELEKKVLTLCSSYASKQSLLRSFSKRRGKMLTVNGIYF